MFVEVKVESVNPATFDMLLGKIPKIIIKNMLLRLDAPDLWKLQQSSKLWKEFFHSHHVWSQWILAEFSRNNPRMDWKYFFRSEKYYKNFTQTVIKNGKTELVNRNRIKHGLRKMSIARADLFRLGGKNQPTAEFKLRRNVKLTSFHYDSNRICCGDMKGSIHMYNIHNGALMESRKYYDGPVHSVQLLSDDSMLSCGGAKKNSKVLITDIQNNDDVEIQCHTPDVYYCALDNLTLIIATMSDDFVLKRLKRKSDITMQQFTSECVTRGELSDIVTFSHCNERLVLATTSSLAIIDLKTGRREKSWVYCSPSDMLVEAAAAGSDEFGEWDPLVELNTKAVFVAMPNFDIKMWDLQGQQRYIFQTANQNPITSLSIEQNILVAGCLNGELQLHRIDQLDDEPVSITASNVDIKNGFLSSLFMLSLDSRSTLIKWSFAKEKRSRKRKSSGSGDWK